MTEHVSTGVSAHLTLACDTLSKINRTLELCLTRIDVLEKENVTLKQRVAELEATRVNASNIVVAPISTPPIKTKSGSVPKGNDDEISLEKENCNKSEGEVAKNNNNLGGTVPPAKTPSTDDDESIETGIKVRSWTVCL